VREDSSLKGIPEHSAGLLWKEEESLLTLSCSLHEEEKEVEQQVFEIIQTVIDAAGEVCHRPDEDLTTQMDEQEKEVETSGLSAGRPEAGQQGDDRDQRRRGGMGRRSMKTRKIASPSPDDLKPSEERRGEGWLHRYRRRLVHRKARSSGNGNTIGAIFRSGEAIPAHTAGANGGGGSSGNGGYSGGSSNSSARGGGGGVEGPTSNGGGSGFLGGSKQGGKQRNGGGGGE